MTNNSNASPGAVLGSYRLHDQPAFIVGTFEKGVTVHSQQTRALNLVWALVETGTVRGFPSGGASDPCDIAIVGGGFSGMTAAAGLLKKQVDASITLFERRDTVLPLQQGSDTRWIHPHIYDWPIAGSESFSAALPILNWTANRASDVVVQVLRDWSRVVHQHSGAAVGKAGRTVEVICNARHLQIERTLTRDGKVRIEWVGESRQPEDPKVPVDTVPSRAGGSRLFDAVILAVGFGLELDLGEASSYWRNETLSQPNLDQAVHTFIVSGSGDGALIDLFRLRISQFRQDRILAELFKGKRELLDYLCGIEYSSDPPRLFDRFQRMESHPTFGAAITAVIATLADRMRTDTYVILQTRHRQFAEIFDIGKVSFQNRLLAFLLYRAGGFHPSSDEIKSIATEHNVLPKRIIARHGTDQALVLKSILDSRLHSAIDLFGLRAGRHQSDEQLWSGGYFNIPANIAAASDDRSREQWRKEYLPSPTESVAAAFCSAVSGYLTTSHPDNRRLRVTLHRTLLMRNERVLQQCCRYAGLELESTEHGDSSGRAFPANRATIGQAFARKSIIRTKTSVGHADLQQAMDTLGLDAARGMKEFVRSILAIPLLTAESPEKEGVVTAVLYLDSEEEHYFDDIKVRPLIAMATDFLKTLARGELASPGTTANVVNSDFWVGNSIPIEPGLKSVPDLPQEFEELATLAPPKAVGPHLYLNLDFSDFEPVELRQ